MAHQIANAMKRAGLDPTRPERHQKTAEQAVEEIQTDDVATAKERRDRTFIRHDIVHEIKYPDR